MIGKMSIGMAVVAAAFALAGVSTMGARAQPTTCQTIGGIQHCDGPKGSSSTRTFGGQTQTQFEDGSSATTRDVGGQRMTQFSNGDSATTRKFGNGSMTTFSNGETATTQKFGAGTITTYSDGRTVTCQMVGAQKVCNPQF